MGDGPVVVVGNSIGGSCATEVARLAPTKIKALVLCGTKPAHRPEPEIRDAALRILAGDGLAVGHSLPLEAPGALTSLISQAVTAAR